MLTPLDLARVMASERRRTATTPMTSPSKSKAPKSTLTPKSAMSKSTSNHRQARSLDGPSTSPQRALSSRPEQRSSSQPPKPRPSSRFTRGTWLTSFEVAATEGLLGLPADDRSPASQSHLVGGASTAWLYDDLRRSMFNAIASPASGRARDACRKTNGSAMVLGIVPDHHRRDHDRQDQVLSVMAARAAPDRRAARRAHPAPETPHRSRNGNAKHSVLDGIDSEFARAKRTRTCGSIDLGDGWFRFEDDKSAITPEA